jgi:hypothetical protein
MASHTAGVCDREARRAKPTAASAHHRRSALPTCSRWAKRLHVGVELAEEPASVLVVYTTHRHPAHYDTAPWDVVPVRPSDVARWIRQARQTGWQPDERGPPFRLLVAAAEPGTASAPAAR